MDSIWTPELIDQLIALWVRRSADGRDRPPSRDQQERRHRQGAPAGTHAAPVAAEEPAGSPPRHRLAAAGLHLAARPSRRQGFPLLRPPPAAGQTLLRRARGHGLYSSEEPQRRLEIRRCTFTAARRRASLRGGGTAAEEAMRALQTAVQDVTAAIAAKSAGLQYADLPEAVRAVGAAMRARLVRGDARRARRGIVAHGGGGGRARGRRRRRDAGRIAARARRCCWRRWSTARPRMRSTTTTCISPISAIRRVDAAAGAPGAGRGARRLGPRRSSPPSSRATRPSAASACWRRRGITRWAFTRPRRWEASAPPPPARG